MSLCMLHAPWTSETARAYGRLGAAKRTSNLAKLKAELKAAKLALKTPAEPKAKPLPHEIFTSRQLSRVRKQIDLLNDKLESAESAQDIDRLASAIARLSERERQLANRPLPGSYKPIAARPKRSYQSSPAQDVETRQSVEPTTGSGVP